MSWLGRLANTLTFALLLVVAAGTLLPVRGEAAAMLARVAQIAIALLFFVHGCKIATSEVLAGLRHWRLHLLIFTATFAIFPVVGWGIVKLGGGLLTPELAAGFLFLSILPATVQSAIAFTSLARGNVAAAVCSASASTLIGIAVTPLLGLVVLPADRALPLSLHSVGRVVLQIFVPFVLGQIARRWLGGFVARHATMVRRIDQSSILFVVYLAFSEARTAGLWSRTPLSSLVAVLGLGAILLVVLLVSTTLLARRLGFAKEDEITIVFCGSKKSLASGIPMAQILFPAASVGSVLLPLMLFHQLQLMVCAWLAERYASRSR